jgi:mono/diheme cytochrome c family protein
VRLLFILLIGLVLFVGCDAPLENFPPNDVYALTLARSRSTATDVAKNDVAEVLTELFGTPDAPQWPAEIARTLSSVDPENITRAAGPLSSEKDGTHVGLFREHCVVCHGLSGSGAGPASQVQTPYPRDFRHGVFKWKSTERSAKPTRKDLKRLLMRGVPGTAMPSFALQAEADIDALVDYIIYLSVRGEAERRLTAAAIDQLDYSEVLPEESLRLTAGDEGKQVIDQVLGRIATNWNEATPVETPAPKPENSIENGKAIFHGQIAGCVGCHGAGGQGQEVTLDYDDWAKEYSTRIGLTPTDREAMRPFRNAGALRPRTVRPRNLQDGVFQGGSDAETLYRRITQGIAGSPMPAVSVVDPENGTGLTEAQVWDLVRYVQSLGHRGRK